MPKLSHSAVLLLLLPALGMKTTCIADKVPAEWLPETLPAVQVSGIRSADPTPLAPRGGIMMVLLTAEVPGTGWPSTITGQLGDGRSVEGRVGWMSISPPDTWTRSWSSETTRIKIRAIHPDDDSRTRNSRPCLFIPLPEDGHGRITLLGKHLSPRWEDPEQAYTSFPLPGLEEPRLAWSRSPDRPDPDQPFAYWRWVLLADRLNLQPPLLPESWTPIETMAALHAAQRWRIALARLGAVSPGVAGACSDILTRTCRDGEHVIGGWITAPTELETLLSILLDDALPPESLQTDALAWYDAQPMMHAWIEDCDSTAVKIALLNRGHDTLPVFLRWNAMHNAPQEHNLPPRTITRIVLLRPRSTGRPHAPFPSEMHRETAAPVQLHVSTNREQRILQLPLMPWRVVPPGMSLPTFHPPISLAEVNGLLSPVVSIATRTHGHLRRRHDRWELFFDCRRPRDDAGKAGEWIQFELARDDVTTVQLLIPESGWQSLEKGDQDGTLQIHRTSWKDRWYCRVVLPDAWMGAVENDAVLKIRCRRSHAGGQTHEESPYAVLPWSVQGGWMEVDTAGWE